MNDDLNHNDLMAFLEEVSKEAGHKLMSYFRGNFAVHYKNLDESHIDIVTDADRAAEDIILEAIGKEFPEHDILSEETPTDKTGSRWQWLVDPLDGTTNFSHGYPVFCVSIALMDSGKLIAGMVHDPLHNETFSAGRGKGALLNGQPISVSSADRLTSSILATGFPYDRATSPDNNLAEFAGVVTNVQGMRRGGSAAIDLSYVACGRLDGFWELKLKPWDMGAGMLLVEEAGGKITDRTGGPTDPYTSSVVASNGIIHDFLIELLDV
jgi:myo-inositol-1(or 4)-monophosphatase